MRNAALDATVLVSAFLTPGGVSDELLRHGREGAFVVFLSEDILAEVVHTLAYPRIRTLTARASCDNHAAWEAPPLSLRVIG